MLLGWCLKKNGAIFTLPGAVELASYGSMVITCGQTEVNNGWKGAGPTDLHVRHGLEYMHRAIRRGSTNFNHQKFLANRGRLWTWKNALNTTVLLFYVMFLLVKWATKKNPLTFHYAGCLTGILLLWCFFFYNNPHIYPKQPRFLFIARICSNHDPTKLLVSQNPPPSRAPPHVP